MSFAHPLWFLLLLLPALMALRMRRTPPKAGMRLPVMPSPGRNWRSLLRQSLPWWPVAALVLLVAAMARPQWRWLEQKTDAEAVDIMLTLDVSLSMLSRDFQPERLTVAKEVLTNFVDNRPFDRLGLVAFGGEAFTQCPLTTDRQMLKNYINALVAGRLDSTAIGMGLATALNRFKNSTSKSKVVILVTDGENNAGYISPMQAAELAKELGVRVYTVGIGTDGLVMAPTWLRGDGTYDYAPRESVIDTLLLRNMAEKADGKFYRAYSPDDLEDIYAEIDRLEKTKIEVSTTRRTTEMAPFLIAAAIVLIFLAQFLRWGLLRAISG